MFVCIHLHAKDIYQLIFPQVKILENTFSLISLGCISNREEEYISRQK